MPLFSNLFPENGQKIKIKEDFDDQNFYICPRNFKTSIFKYHCFAENNLFIRCNCAKEIHLLEYTEKIYWEEV
jgi:hypothetical protein